ncbi:D-aspartate oxidase [Monoraphidium neglectum]|uniref:D-aspartate oxidase n=1 Tax=Monoraphidium neglectum TaxID=145388 RepID=A0A0D2LIS4_9CHLO|nr:D-aspartate oxidase [Monoraphidium neglectum]KIZ06364.1 D-aspartate oxidase [Monoraphidium neglectum]|eukprot:XP_013905383.1 D-aspartate oxidase [Monoraphidium neglectum]
MQPLLLFITDQQNRAVTFRPVKVLCSRFAARRQQRTVAAAAGHICVVGGGVVGLTTALRLLQEIPGCCVQVYAEAWGTDLVSAGAAGFWEPYKLSETPDESVYRWGKDTFDHIQGLVHSSAAATAGVSTVHATSLFRGPEPTPFWADITGGFCRLKPEELRLYSGSPDWADPFVTEAGGAAAAGAPQAWVDGYAFNSLLCEGRLYMRWLVERIKEAGGQLDQRGLNGLGDLAEEGYDALVVCCGLGAKQLLGDDDCYPIRGQIARVRAPWVRECVFGHWGDEVTYIIPNREWVVIGGTGQVGDWRTSTDLGDAEAIMQRARQLLPSLEGAELLDHWVGLRPGRTQLRLELEWTKLEPGGATASSDGEGANGDGVNDDGADGGGGSAKRGATPVVYNYGHGGAGLTLAWGTAGDAVQLVKQALGA